MKSVLQVCAFGAPNPGNFIASLFALEKRLTDKGYSTIYAFAETAKDKAWCKDLCKDHRVYFLPVAKARILPSTYIVLKKIYKENDVSIVHSHFELYDIPVTVTAPKGVKIFWHLHDPLQENYFKGSLSRKILTKIQYGFFGKKAILLSVSEKHAYFAEKLGFKKEQIHYLPNGLNTDRIVPIHQETNSSDFLMFGWDVKRKGVDLAVKAMQQIGSEQIHLVIVGGQECRSYLTQYSTTGIICKEPVDNVNELYCQSKAFLHISRAEGQSYALLEVIYAGLPVICSDIPENQFAREFRNIHFVRNENYVDITDAIMILNTQLLISTEDAEYNRRLIDQKYSLNTWCVHLLNFYFGGAQDENESEG